MPLSIKGPIRSPRRTRFRDNSLGVKENTVGEISRKTSSIARIIEEKKEKKNRSPAKFVPTWVKVVLCRRRAGVGQLAVVGVWPMWGLEAQGSGFNFLKAPSAPEETEERLLTFSRNHPVRPLFYLLKGLFLQKKKRKRRRRNKMYHRICSNCKTAIMSVSMTSDKFQLH